VVGEAGLGEEPVDDLDLFGEHVEALASRRERQPVRVVLAEQIEIIHGLFTEPGFTHHGPRYRLTDCPFLPAPLQRPHPPIILGGKAGPRLADLVARYATEFNSNQGSPATCRERFERVRAAAVRQGRDPDSIRTSVMTGVVIGATPTKYRARLRQTAEWMHTDPQALLEAHGSTWVLGTPEQAAERLAAFAAVGVERVMLQHNLHRDLDSVELLAQEVFPRVMAASAHNRAGPQQARSSGTGVR
jgi:alkanesulfonate monooxygenase SsuD/methylene tetrahydromethanopterin reductase-like flavin-dependent oxidoreductase (luciferase family)